LAVLLEIFHDQGDGLNSISEADSEAFLLVCGDTQAKVWGLGAAERLRRMAAASGLSMVGAIRENYLPLIIANAAIAFDPAWLRFIIGKPGHVVTLDGRPVIAHIPSGEIRQAEAVASAIADDANPFDCSGLKELNVVDSLEIYSSELRKKERPFMMAFTPENAGAIERASYYGAYKGVTDILTKYLWPELAFHLTRFAAWLRLSPNSVTAVGAVLCIAATFAFFDGRYWLGLFLGFVFTVLDTVDGKLARCTITSSWWGHVLDHGIDLVHPPFWWWAWGAGLSAYGKPIEQNLLLWILAVIVTGYVLQRIVEGVFIRYHGMHIHVWRPVDSTFRLVTARRNPNMAILFVSMIFARPDLGLYAIAFWTVASLLFHTVRLAQAFALKFSGKHIVSWLI